MWELQDPLDATHAGVMDGVGAVSTALLCETLLSMLPSMNTRHMPYALLKEYHVVPIESGVIGRTNHISLQGLAVLRG